MFSFLNNVSSGYMFPDMSAALFILFILLLEERERERKDKSILEELQKT